MPSKAFFLENHGSEVTNEGYFQITAKKNSDKRINKVMDLAFSILGIEWPFWK